MPDWVTHAVWWHVYPLGFLGAERTALAPGAAVEHRLPQLLAWLDYAVELGASGLALGPVFASKTHGYDTVDHLRIDARLGNDDEFDALVAAAHERGLKVLLDGVFNHVGRDFPAFAQAVADPGAPTASWFRLHWPDDPPRAGTEPVADTFEGHDALVALDHDEPAVADYVAEVMEHWLARGADGWRLDAAYAVPPRFWAQVLPRVRARFPDAYVVGEVIHGDYAAIVRESGMDAVTQYELWKAVWSSLNDRNLSELSWALERHDGFLDSFVPSTFLGNHDVTRIATRLSDERHRPHALAVLLTVGGTPSIYAGDEQGFTGRKEDRAGGDDAVRPPFPSSPGDLAPFGWPVYRLHQQLIALRRRNPWLHRARTRVIDIGSTHLLYESAAEGQALVVALSVDDAPLRVRLPGAGTLLAGDGATDAGSGAGPAVRLPPHGWAVLRLGGAGA